MIDEMLEDTFEGLEDDDLEELADKEVEKVLFEVTNGERRGEERKENRRRGSGRENGMGRERQRKWRGVESG